MNEIDQIVELIFNNISARVTDRKKQLKKTKLISLMKVIFNCYQVL